MDAQNILENIAKKEEHNITLKASSLIIFTYVLIFFADGVNQILKYYDFGFYRISIFIRFALLVFCIFLLNKKKKIGNIFFILVFFYSVFLIGSISALPNYEDYLWFENLSMITKMLLVFVILNTLNIIFTRHSDRNRLFQTFEFLILTQSIVVIFSFILKIEMFSSYESGLRFGYSGLIPARNETSAFFIVAFFYFLYRFHYQQKYIIGLFIVTTAALLTGTKVTLIIPVILFFYISRGLFGIFRKGIKRQYLFASLIFLAIIIVALYKVDYLISELTPTINYYSNWVENYGFTTFDIIASGRQFNIIELYNEELRNFNIINYLFGGYDLAQAATESDLIDVFIRLGLIGGFGFYYFYIIMLLPTNHHIHSTHLLFVIVWLGVSITAGHIVFSAINGGYLAILIFFFVTFASDRGTFSRRTIAQNPPVD